MKSHVANDASTNGHEAVAARVLIASLVLVAGLRKLMNWTATAAVFGKLGVPSPEWVLPLVVLLELGGGLLLVLGGRVRWVAYALAAFTQVAGVIGHAFWSAKAAPFGHQLNVAVCSGLVGVAAPTRRPA